MITGIMWALCIAVIPHAAAVGFGPPPDASLTVQTDVDRVTYLTLSPDVGVTVTLNNQGPTSRDAILECFLLELTQYRHFASRVENIRLEPGQASRRFLFPLRLNRMLGLLAVTRLVDPADGSVLAQDQRPFDVTNDLRTNFRYAGETYANVERRLPGTPLKGDGHTDMDFWEPIPVGCDPHEMIDRLRTNYQNVAQVSIEGGRGYFTCWEDGSTTWGKSAYLMNDFWLMSLGRIRYLYTEGPRNGVYMMPWTDHKGARQDYFGRDFPWIDKHNPEGYYPGCWQMNLDPAYRHRLTPDEEKLARHPVHEADSWLVYAVDQLFRASVYYHTILMWWDNSYGGAHIPYTLDTLRKRWADERPDAPPPVLMINGFAGYHSDVIWIEYPLPLRMQDYVRLLHRLVEERPEVKNGGATVSFGQVHPGTRTGQQQAISDPANVYNDPDTTFVYRQLLFECVSAEARLVYQQQWPRNCLEYRIDRFPKAFKEHAKTWGFLTQFEHVYNSRDVMPYPLAETVRVDDIPTTCGNFIADDQLHIVSRSSMSNPDVIYLHLFNYRGTTAETYARRPRPIPQTNVTIHLTTPGFAQEYDVRVFSPDFPRFGDCLEPATRCTSNEMQFTVPVDLYTLIVVMRRWT